MEKKTVSVTMWAGQAELIQRAADAAHVSASEYVRASLVPIAAAQLGVATPDFPSFEPPRFRRSEVTLAAEALGVTPAQFTAKIAREAAAKVLEELSSKSGERRAVEYNFARRTG